MSKKVSNILMIGGDEDYQLVVRMAFGVHTDLKLHIVQPDTVAVESANLDSLVVINALSEPIGVSRIDSGVQCIVALGKGHLELLFATVRQLDMRKRGPKCSNVQFAAHSQERVA